MNKPAHTPGPWVVMYSSIIRNKDTVYAQSGRFIADCELTPYGSRPQPPNSTDEANARLIAAAPAMYEALRNLLEVYQDSTDDDGSPVVLNAIDALAQAEGVGHE